MSSNVRNMNGMFVYSKNFNQSLSSWNTSNVTDLAHMFHGSYSFNADLSGWDTSSVKDMSYMFSGDPWGCKDNPFNQNISTWNTSNVTNMNRMFYSSKFNQDISIWNTSNVIDMSRMFQYCDFFDQDLSTWNISNVTNFTGFIDKTPITTSKYDEMLKNWSLQSVQDNVTFGAEDVKYNSVEAVTARNNLINNHGWDYY